MRFSFALLILLGLPLAPKAMATDLPAPTLVVSQGRFSRAHPWRVPRNTQLVSLRRSTDGATPHQPTSVAVWRDRTALLFLFRVSDDSIAATLTERDAPLYTADVVEVFLSPATLTEYFELEVNPLNTVFDARISSPDGVSRTMRGDTSWTCQNLFTAVRPDPSRSNGSEVLLRIPFTAVTSGPPRRGTRWRANLFRVDKGSYQGKEFSAWSPTLRNPADFHVAGAFGTLLFD